MSIGKWEDRMNQPFLPGLYIPPICRNRPDVGKCRKVPIEEVPGEIPRPIRNNSFEVKFFSVFPNENQAELEFHFSDGFGSTFRVKVPCRSISITKNALPDWREMVKRENAEKSKGHVYFCHSWHFPGIGSVGMTQQLVSDHLKEIEGKMVRDLRQYYSLDDMPFAGAVEQEAHRLLEKKRYVPPETKGAWFICGTPNVKDDKQQVREIIDAIIQAAFTVRAYAIRVNALPDWADPIGTDFKKPKHPKEHIFDRLK